MLYTLIYKRILECFINRCVGLNNLLKHLLDCLAVVIVVVVVIPLTRKKQSFKFFGRRFPWTPVCKYKLQKMKIYKKHVKILLRTFWCVVRPRRFHCYRLRRAMEPERGTPRTKRAQSSTFGGFTSLFPLQTSCR